MRAIDWCPCQLTINVRITGANIQRFKLTTKKKTLNNVKTNIFVAESLISRAIHLIYIRAQARKSPGAHASGHFKEILIYYENII